MSRDIPESDWRQFKEVHKILLERFCQQTLTEVTGIVGAGESAHERYLKVYRLLHRQDKELARAFNGSRRSTVLIQLTVMRGMGLLTDEELLRFTPETQRVIGMVEARGRD